MKHPLELAPLLASLQHKDPPDMLRALVAQGFDQLPLPGQGQTLDRWRALASVAACNLSLAKLYESHTDALAMMAELGAPTPAPHQIWAVWAAEPPTQRVQAKLQGSAGSIQPGSPVQLSGTKAWCSGAQTVDHALVTAWLSDEERCLVAVPLQQPGIHITSEGWQAVGMAASASVDVQMDHAAGRLVGVPGSYLSRPGFHHGGAGIAACWYGASTRIASYLLQASRDKPDPHTRAHLGAVDVALSGVAELLRSTAAKIDAFPGNAWAMEVSRVRLAAEAVAQEVLIRVPRAMGPGPLCKDRTLALLVADLPVFVRQSHAERDLAALGQSIAQATDDQPWAL